MMTDYLFEVQSKGRGLRKSKRPYWMAHNTETGCTPINARNEAGTLFYCYEDVKDMIEDNKTFKQAYEQAKKEGLDKFCFQGVWVDAKLLEDEAFKQFRNGKAK